MYIWTQTPHSYRVFGARALVKCQSTPSLSLEEVIDAWAPMIVFSVKKTSSPRFLDFLRHVWKKPFVSVIRPRRAFPRGLGAASVWDVSLPVGSVDLPVMWGDVQTRQVLGGAAARVPVCSPPVQASGA